MPVRILNAISELAAHDAAPQLTGLLLLTLLYACSSRRSLDGPPTLPRLLAGILSLATSVALANLVVNPYGLYPSRLFEPATLHSRADKTRLYERLPRPEVVILSSSTLFVARPADIVATTGRTAFNASVQGGTARDYLGFLRFMQARRKTPDVVLISFSMHLFRPDVSVGFEPNDPLRRYLREDAASGTAGVRQVLGLAQTQASLKLVAAELRGRPAPYYVFGPDGAASFAPSTRLVDAAVDDMIARDWAKALRFSAPDQYQLECLEEFLDVCRTEHVTVVALFAPYHPKLASYLSTHSREPQHRAALAARLEPWLRDGTIAALHDFSRVEDLGLSSSHFLDPFHLDEEGTRRLVTAALQDLTAR